MYNIPGYGQMIADRIRTAAYAQALRQSIKPGCAVLDIGTGTGIFALLACRFGAGHVYALEPDDAIQVAREIATANGYAERITFIQGLSSKVNLPQRADVIVSDLRGVLPLFGYHLPSIIDARQRFLAPGGALVPTSDTLWAAVVEEPRLYQECTASWEGNGYGLDMQAARWIATNTWRKARVTSQQLCVEPQRWATLDYATLESSNIRAEVNWTASRAGVAHGFVVWFDSTLAEGTSFSNAPGTPELIYGNAFFPWSTPVDLAAGDSIKVKLGADLVGEDYIWSWETRVTGPVSKIKASFKQSTFFGAPLSASHLRKLAASHAPALNEDGRIDQFILALMRGSASLGEIATRVSAQFPERFPRWQDAFTHVGALSEKYSL